MALWRKWKRESQKRGSSRCNNNSVGTNMTTPLPHPLAVKWTLHSIKRAHGVGGGGVGGGVAYWQAKKIDPTPTLERRFLINRKKRGGEKRNNTVVIIKQNRTCNGVGLVLFGMKEAEVIDGRCLVGLVRLSVECARQWTMENGVIFSPVAAAITEQTSKGAIHIYKKWRLKERRSTCQMLYFFSSSSS